MIVLAVVGVLLVVAAKALPLDGPATQASPAPFRNPSLPFMKNVSEDEETIFYNISHSRDLPRKEVVKQLLEWAEKNKVDKHLIKELVDERRQIREHHHRRVLDAIKKVGPIYKKIIDIENDEKLSRADVKGAIRALIDNLETAELRRIVFATEPVASRPNKQTYVHAIAYIPPTLSQE